MQRRIFSGVLGLGILVGLVSCNIYRPLDTAKSDSAHTEEAIRCYVNSDPECAVEQYKALTPGLAQNRQLCVAYLNQAGMTLDLLINKMIGALNGAFLGTIASALIPWNSTKGEGATNAITACAAFAADTEAQAAGSVKDTATLLTTVASLIDCATRLSHAHAFGDKTNLSGANCMTTSYISASETKVIVADVEGMCDVDALACQTDISSISGSQLTASGLGSLKSSFDFLSTLGSAGSAAAARTVLATLVTAK